MIAWPSAFAASSIRALISGPRRRSEVRTLVNQDRLGSLDRPLREIIPAVDGYCFHCGALRVCWRMLTTTAPAICIAFAPQRHSGFRAQAASSRPLRFARSRRFLTEEGAHLVPPRGVRS